MARAVLAEKKGQDICLLDVRGISGFSDYTLIVTGNSPPHVRALHDGVLRAGKDAGVHAYRHTGDPESGWMVIDYVDVVIHVFSDQARRYYAVEELWAKAPRLP